MSGGVAMTILAWLQGLPAWLLVALGTTVFIVAVLLALAVKNLTLSIRIKKKQARKLDSIVEIDRDDLASDLEKLSSSIAALVGEYRGPMQEAWWASAESKDAASIRLAYAQIEGKLVEKYSYKFAADATRLIRRASKVVPIDSAALWNSKHGVRGEHQIVEMYMLLASLADDVRSPKEPLPVAER